MSLLETYGNYQLVEKLAMGGMAQLFLARRRQKGADRTVVLKRILPHLAEDTAFVTMFLDEARIAARLHHPNVIEILDLGAEGDSYFIAMEYIHGEDLRRITKRGIELNTRMPAPLVCRVLAEAAKGLDYAHKRTDANGKPLKIVHRDVSPQNILVGFDGAVKVVDFGIAKAADKATVTASGVIKGKHAYMSPEQALGREIDHRTDVFALGIVLFEALTATRLFRRATDLQTLKAVSECKVEPPSKVFPAVPAELDPIILKALTKDLSARYQSALELAEALEGWLGGRSDGSREALGAYVSGLFQERLDREAREGKFSPTRSQIEVDPVQRRPSLPNAPTASLRQAVVPPKTVTDKGQVPPSPLENRNTDLTPAFVPPDSPPPVNASPRLATPVPPPPVAEPVPAVQLSSTALAKPVLTPEARGSLEPVPTVPTESVPVDVPPAGGTALYGKAQLGTDAPGGTALYGRGSPQEPKTITELSDRAAKALDGIAKQTVSARPDAFARSAEHVTEEARAAVSAPRMWPWWLGATVISFAIAAGVGKLIVDRRALLGTLKAPAAEPVAVVVPDAGVALAMKQPPTAPTGGGGTKAEAQAPGAGESAPTAPGNVPELPKEKMKPFGSVPVSVATFPLQLKQGELLVQLPAAGALSAGENVRIVGPPRGGTRDRDFYGVASVAEVNASQAKLLFQDSEALPDGLFISPEDEAAHTPKAATPTATKGSALVGSVQLKQGDPQADVAVKNATDFDWSQCEVRLPDNRSMKLHGATVIKAGGTQWITGSAFKLRGGGADPKLGEGFAFVKCAEGDGYLKAANLP